MNTIEQLKNQGITIQENIELKDYTTLKIGGPAKIFVHAKSKEDLLKILQIAKENNEKIFILGKGSNVLISDKGFNGIVIYNTGNNIQVDEKNEMVTSESGVALGRLIAETVKHGLQGLETLVGVPASVGGAIHHNAGTREGEIKETITQVEVFNLKTGEHFWMNNKECQFEYRKSFFSDNPDYIILSAEFALKKSNKETLSQKLKENLEYKHKTQNYAHPTAGCTFRNYTFKNKEDKQKAIELGLEKGIKDMNLAVGWLIDKKLHLKNFTLGKVKISDTHCNFIENIGGATAEEFIILVSFIKQKARDTYGIQLQEEVEYIGF